MFKTIARHPNYEIDRNGNVRRKGSDLIRKPFPVNGHPKIILDGKTEYISRLVAETYIPNPEGMSDVMHVNRDKACNDAENLRWATHGEIQYDYNRYFQYEHPNSPKRVVIVETGEEFPSIRSCARAVNGCASGIRRCLDDDSLVYKGFHYKILA